MARDITILDVWKMLGGGKEKTVVTKTSVEEGTVDGFSRRSPQLKVEVLNKYLGRGI